MIFTEGKEKTGGFLLISGRFCIFVGDKGTYGLHSARRGRNSGNQGCYWHPLFLSLQFFILIAQ